MQIVIEISENKYKYIKKLDDDITDYQTSLMIYKAIKNGTVLPDNHGRLIEADKVECKLRGHHDFYLSAYDNDFRRMPIDVKARCDEISASIAEVVNAPTILEARKVKQERSDKE